MTRHPDASSLLVRSRSRRRRGRFGATSAMTVIALLALALAGCGRVGPGATSDQGEGAGQAAGHGMKARPGDDRVVGRLDGRDVTLGELHRYMQEQFLDELLRQPEAELYGMRERALRDMAQRHVIETAAAERGVTPEALFDEITAAAPSATPEDVSAWYAANESRLRGARLEDLAPRIQQLLDEEARSEAWQAFLEPRLEALDWAVTIEPPREQLEPTRLVRGNEDAPITLMTFSDYQCPYCIRSEPVLAEVLERYPEQVRLIHRHFPLDSIHPFARPASEAAMCADEQGRFWDYHDAIFARGGRLSAESFEEIGRELDLDLEALDACIEARRYREFVDRDFAAGEAAGVTGTPAFFINGIALRGAQDADAISAVIDAELARLAAD
jgi:predicted DsbA family dithiol-disulfide isomerase